MGRLMSVKSIIFAGVAACLAIAGTAPPSLAQTAFAPVAVVNDDVITFYDVEQRARLLALTGGRPGPELNQASLDGLIDDALRLQAGRRFDVVASQEEINAAVGEFAARLRIDQAQLEQSLAAAGVDQTALADFLSSQVVWRSLVNRRFGPRATPSEIELDQEIDLAASGRTRAFRLSEIAVPAGEGQEAAARQLIERVRAELAGGADFAELARRYSRTPSAQNGGDVGWVPETTMPPDLAELLAATPPGGVTPPYNVPGGISLYRVADTREEAPPWAQEAQMSLRRISIEGDDDDARARANAIRDETDGCESIPDLSDQATMESLDRKLVNALPGPVRGAVQLLQAGQASRPVVTEGRTEVFVVCDRTGGVDAEVRNNLREQIRVRRLSRLAEGYLQDLRREAVIERR